MPIFSSFLLGAFSALSALFVELLIVSVASFFSPEASSSLGIASLGGGMAFFLLAGIVEESGKYAALRSAAFVRFFPKNIPNIPLLAFAVGFCVPEFLLILQNTSFLASASSKDLFGIFALHSLTVFWIGFSMRTKTHSPALILGTAIAIHIAYNAFVAQ